MKLSQDNYQRIQTTMLLVLEFYKIAMGTFLFTFVPQSCLNEETDEYETCAMSEIIGRTDTFSGLTHLLNLVTFSQILMFYYIEYKRENWCIKYLDICENTENTNLDEEIEKYPTFKSKIAVLNYRYKNLSINAFVWCIMNIVVSIISIARFQAGMTTITSLLGFCILVMMKMFSSYRNASASLKKERVYSAYMIENKTYNTIDDDYKIPDTLDENVETNTENDDVNNDVNSECETSSNNAICESDVDVNIEEDNDISLNKLQDCSSNIVRRDTSSNVVC